MKVCAILSLLHEGADRFSATRAFREASVLHWTLERLSRSRHIHATGMICWEDQLPKVAGIAQQFESCVLAKGPRLKIPQVEAVAAARRWSEGWRGGLYSACCFDLGFYAPWALELADGLETDTVVLVDPSASLIDPGLLDRLVEHSQAHLDHEIVFAPAAPGLCGALLRRPLLERLAASKTHPGRILHYLPDQVSREMIAGDNCLPVPPAIARTSTRFTLDSDRQIRRIARATEALNGQLIGTGAEDLVRRVERGAWQESLPRELVLEINTNRLSSPIFWPGAKYGIARPSADVETLRPRLQEMSTLDDARVTVSGVGDPLCSPAELFGLLDVAQSTGISAIHVETDLLTECGDDVVRLAESSIDILSVHLPATNAETYRHIMGIDAMPRVLENIRIFVSRRHERSRGLPLLVPIFTKCQANLGEMEAWYDQWLRIFGCAVVRGPTRYGNLLDDVSVGEMAPPQRHPCNRLRSRLTILCDGTVVSCEEDVLARQPMGRIQIDSLSAIWTRRFDSLRSAHLSGEFQSFAVCAHCSEWHRP